MLKQKDEMKSAADKKTGEERLLASGRFKSQIEFILEADKLKQIQRRTTLLNRSRQENSAEHCWHIALIVLILAEYADEDNLDRIFNILPADQAALFRSLWDAYEARETPESRFANALDRLQPLLHNYFTRGHTWQKHGIRKNQVLERMKPVDDGSHFLWDYVARLIDDAVEKGYLKK
jgi:putative hydrolase of HD superfamily